MSVVGGGVSTSVGLVGPGVLSSDVELCPSVVSVVVGCVVGSVVGSVVGCVVGLGVVVSKEVGDAGSEVVMAVGDVVSSSSVGRRSKVGRRPPSVVGVGEASPVELSSSPSSSPDPKPKPSPTPSSKPRCVVVGVGEGADAGSSSSSDPKPNPSPTPSRSPRCVGIAVGDGGADGSSSDPKPRPSPTPSSSPRCVGVVGEETGDEVSPLPDPKPKPSPIPSSRPAIMDECEIKQEARASRINECNGIAYAVLIRTSNLYSHSVLTRRWTGGGIHIPPQKYR